MEELERELKQLIVESLRLEGVEPQEIDSGAPLFVEGLGLDSIDSLELAVAIRRKYGVKTAADDARNAAIFANVKSLAAYVAQQRQPKA
jgi:acyl carrier protein